MYFHASKYNFKGYVHTYVLLNREDDYIEKEGCENSDACSDMNLAHFEEFQSMKNDG